MREEVLELLAILEDRAEYRIYPIDEEQLIGSRELLADVPLSVHARYTRREVFAALCLSTLAKPFSHRE